MVNACPHLNPPNQQKLLQVLAQFPKLFSGNLGRKVHRKSSISLKYPNVTPIFCNTYSIPLVHQQVFQKELQHLVEEKVLKRIDRSEWVFPIFLIPKKDRCVRWISDFRCLNKLLKRPRYFLPSIPAIMQKRAGFFHITKLDISMFFYTFESDAHAQQYCVISIPFVLYQYLRLPMGLTNSPDVFQSVMHPLFQDLPSVKCFIDDIGVFTNSTFYHHLSIVKQVLLRLEDSGFTINPLPTTPTHVHSFVGLINYYKDMWPRRVHILAHLTELCGAKRKFTWNDTHENAFNLARRLIAEDVLLRFPNHELPFEIYTDASNFQIGATIKQANLPIAYFSKKLTPTRGRYSTIEHEMLVIVEVLKEYRNFLLGANITIFNDHENLLSNSTTNNRIFRWKQKIQ